METLWQDQTIALLRNLTHSFRWMDEEERMDGTEYRRAGRDVGKASSWSKNIIPHPPSNPRGLKRQLRTWPQVKGTRWIPQVRPSWHKLRRHSSQFPSLPLSKRQQASLWTSFSSIKSSSVLQSKCLCPKDSKKLLNISSFFFLSNTQSHETYTISLHVTEKYWLFFFSFPFLQK